MKKRILEEKKEILEPLLKVMDCLLKKIKYNGDLRIRKDIVILFVSIFVICFPFSTLCENPQVISSPNTEVNIKFYNSTINDSIKFKMQNEYFKYCNNRFSFCIYYPSNFIPQGEADNGDGQCFLAKNGKAKICSYGSLVVDNISTLETSYNFALNRGKITYKKKRKGYYVVSGINENKIFYKKTIQRKIIYGGSIDVDVLITHMIEYPINDKKIYDSYCAKINNDLK